MGNLGSKKEQNSVSELLGKVKWNGNITDSGIKLFKFQLHKAYEKSLLPLERETLFNILGDPPYSEADIQAKPMLLMMGNTPEH